MHFYGLLASVSCSVHCIDSVFKVEGVGNQWLEVDVAGLHEPDCVWPRVVIAVDELDVNLVACRQLQRHIKEARLQERAGRW